MVGYETWWDTDVVSGKRYTIAEFKAVLDGSDREIYLDIVKDGESVLDVGCGVGLDYEMYNKHDVDVGYVGIDSCRGFIEHNKLEHPEATFMHGKSYELPFEDKSFDIVTCRHVLEHLKEPYTTLAEICRVGKRVAIIWFIPPGKKEKIVLREKGFYKNTYSRKTLESFISALGFEFSTTDMFHTERRTHQLWYLTQ